MSILGTKFDKRHLTLKVCLQGSSDEQFAQVKAALCALEDPKLEVTEMAITPSGAGSENGNGNGQGKYPKGAQVADVVMVMVKENEEATFRCLQHHAESSPRPALFAVLPERSPLIMRQAIRAGADELLFLPVDVGDAMRALIKVAEARQRTARTSGGVVCSVTSLMGGAGVTTLSVNLALALRYTLDRRVALVDLDLQAGMAAIALNVEPEHSIFDLAASGKNPDSIQVEAALTKHSSGLYLLAAPKHIEDSEHVPDRTIDQVLDLMRQMFDFVVVDCGNHVFEQTVAAWEKSDRMLYVLDQSIGGARCAWRFISLFERLKLANVKPHFVVNRHMVNHPVTVDQVGQTLLRPIYAQIPRDDKTMDRVEMGGKDLWQVAPGSLLTRRYEELARRLVETPGEARVERSAGVVSRLVSAIVSRSRGAYDETN